MALQDSNTYIEPTAGTSLNAARSQVNNSLRSLLTNFRSTSPPDTENITRSGVGAGEEDGMLYRSATTNALYVSDSVHVKSSPVGGNFTRVGIGNRVENGIVALAGNIASYEIGELVATPSASGGLSSNARLYLISSNSATMTSVVDVGIPPTNGSITDAMIGTRQISNTKLVASTISTHEIGSRAVANTQIKAATITTHEIASRAVANTQIAAASITRHEIKDGGIAPIGSVMAWTGSSAPDGWLLCDGTAISRSTYAALFAISGTAYGVGNGSTTFNIPDLQDRLPLGKGTNNSTLGTQTGSMAASSKVTTDSGGASLQTASQQTIYTDTYGSKDAVTINFVTAATSSAHTHGVTIPTSVVNYIIKY